MWLFFGVLSIFCITFFRDCTPTLTKKPPMKLNEFWSKWRRFGKITNKKMSPFISLQVLQQFPFSFQFNSLLLEVSLSSF